MCVCVCVCVCVNVCMFGLYPSILHNVALETLRRTLGDRVNKKLILGTLL